jgi:hypothetical protein
MSTKLDQSQIDGLPEEIQSLDLIDVSLEAKISSEDSQNDQVDINLQGQIDDLKSTVLSLVFGNSLYVNLDHDTFYAMTPTQFPIMVTSTVWEWYLESEVISEAIYSSYTATVEGYYKAKVTYTTQLGIKVMESYPIFFTPR